MDKAELRARREAIGLTQGQLARAFGVGRRTMQEWESGSSPIRPIVEFAIETLERDARRYSKRWREIVYPRPKPPDPAELLTK